MYSASRNWVCTFCRVISQFLLLLVAMTDDASVGSERFRRDEREFMGLMSAYFAPGQADAGAWNVAYMAHVFPEQGCMKLKRRRDYHPARYFVSDKRVKRTQLLWGRVQGALCRLWGLEGSGAVAFVCGEGDAFVGLCMPYFRGLVWKGEGSANNALFDLLRPGASGGGGGAADLEEQRGAVAKRVCMGGPGPSPSPPTSPDELCGLPSGWAGCPFGWDTLSGDKEVWELTLVMVKQAHPRELRDILKAVAPTVAGGDVWGWLRDAGRPVQLGVLHAMFVRGFLVADDVPEWARTAAGVVREGSRMVGDWYGVEVGLVDTLWGRLHASV